MPLGRNITRRFGFGRNTAPEAMSQNARKEISLPLNLITSSEGFFDDLVSGDGSIFSSSVDNKTSDARISTSSSNNDKSNSDSGSPTSPPSLTDASSVEGSPTNDQGFLAPTLPDLEPAEPRGLFASSDAPPAIPKRVPSHSKKEHVRLARKRSLRSSDTSLASAVTTSPSKPVFSAGPTLDEEPLLEVDEDSRFDVAYMRERGLRRFSANAYQNELAPLSPWTNDGAPSWI